MERDETSARKVDPYHLVYRGGQFPLIAYHERDAVRVFRLSRIQGKVGYASKAEHDFAPPEDFDRRDYARRADWQMGEIEGRARIFLRDRIAWLVERDFGEYGEIRPAGKEDAAWAEARSSRPITPSRERRSPGCCAGGATPRCWRRRSCAEAEERPSLLHDRHADGFELAETVDRPRAGPDARGAPTTAARAPSAPSASPAW